MAFTTPTMLKGSCLSGTLDVPEVRHLHRHVNCVRSVRRSAGTLARCSASDPSCSYPKADNDLTFNRRTHLSLAATSLALPLFPHTARADQNTSVCCGRVNWISKVSHEDYTFMLLGNVRGYRVGAGVDAFYDNLQRRVTEFTLENGLHFIVLERHVAPVVSCHIYADVGAFDEREGQTGIAHLLEHMAFKGSTSIGTKNYRDEVLLLQELDDVFYTLREAKQAGQTAEVLRLSEQFRELQLQAEKVVVPNEFGATLQRAGAVGLNAATSHDATKYYASLPANKLELWFALEAERFQAPVFRQLYTEKQVVAEERRMRIDNSPLGKFTEGFAARAMTNNYRRPVIGYPEDVESIGRRELGEFFFEHYGPNNLTIAIVGDVTPDQVEQYANKYFGRWLPVVYKADEGDDVDSSSSPAEEPLPRPLSGPTTYSASSPAGPLVMLAYYRQGLQSPDAIPLDAISDLLSGSRTSRLYKNLVQSGKAISASFTPTYPSDKHACAALTYAVPTPGVSLSDMEQQLRAQLRGLADAEIDDRELQRIKKASRFGLLDSVRSNASMASVLCSYHALTGSWQNLFTDLEATENLSKDTLREVAARTFTDNNSYVGLVLPQSRVPASAPAAL